MALSFEWKRDAGREPMEAVLTSLVRSVQREVDAVGPEAVAELVDLARLAWNLSRLDTGDAISGATRVVGTYPEPERWEAARRLARLFVLASEGWPNDARRVARVRLLDDERLEVKVLEGL